MKLNKIEVDYFENRHYENEADKRSQQFREVAKRINDIVDYLNELDLYEHTGLTKTDGELKKLEL